ncbi:MAG: prepilin-type N-terminal cleavage/methylation domain-containing protein [bacterium]|nr:prepilin-type N-terminal cleavage/methylation domain-containing protein [bacterium]
MRRSSRQVRGFTLVELLLYVALTTIMVGTISVFLFMTLQVRVKNQVINEVEQQGQQAMQRITQVIRNATDITAPVQGASGASTTLVVTPTGNSPTVFALTAGALRITEGAGTAVVLTNGRVIASALTFTNLSRSASSHDLRVQFTLTAVNNSGRNEYDFAKTFTTSAHVRP